MSLRRLHGLCGQAPEGDWNVAPPDSPFLVALERAAPQLRLADRFDLLLDQLMEQADRRRLARSEGGLVCPLWPPLLRAVHGLGPGIDPTELLGLQEPPALVFDAPAELHPRYRVFFHSDRAWELYRERVEWARGSGTVAVAGVLLRDPQGRLLLERRSPAKRFYPLYWDSPGGKLNAGESAPAAAVREIEEEYGLSLVADSLRPLGELPDREPTLGIPFKHYVFRADLESVEPAVYHAPDAVDLGWFKPEEALRLPGLPRPLRAVLSTQLTTKVLAHE